MLYLIDREIYYYNLKLFKRTQNYFITIIDKLEVNF